MDKQHILLEQYRIYTESKERYTERAFMINRFFMVIVGLLFLSMLGFKCFYPESYFLLSGIGFFGFMLCVMWISNQDAYSTIIKIKYSAVLEKMEEHLPHSPVKDEYQELQNQRKDRKIILVKDTQKWFAVILMLIFLAVFLLDVCNLVLKTFVCV